MDRLGLYKFGKSVGALPVDREDHRCAEPFPLIIVAKP